MASLLPIMDMLKAVVTAKLSISHFRTLLLLRDHPRDCSAIAYQLGITSAAVTGVVDALEARRLVSRIRTHKDRRLITICLSPDGEALLSTLTKHLSSCP